MILFPAIDLKEGLAVRLEQGDMARATVFHRDPAAQARAFETQGFEYLHIVDLDGAFAGKPVNAAAVDRILETRQHSGAARRRRPRHGDRRRLARAKASTRVIIGTAAVRDPRFRQAKRRSDFPGKIAVGLDARDGKVAVEGWAETSELSALDIARRFEDAGVAAIIYTDIARDGMLKGINLDATIALADAISIPVIASGGLASIEDIKALLEPRAKKLEGAIAGRALYDGRLDAAEALQAHPRGADGGLMFKVRVIPCLDVKDGRVVKGVNFVDLRDAGDPVEAAIAYDAAGADELDFPRHHRQPRKPRHDLRRGDAHGGSLLHAADRRRRRAHGRRYPQAADLRRRQGVDQYRGGEPARFRQGGGGEIRRPMHRGRDRRQESVEAPARKTAGRSSPMAAAIRPASMRSPTPRKSSRSAPAKSC